MRSPAISLIPIPFFQTLKEPLASAIPLNGPDNLVTSRATTSVTHNHQATAGFGENGIRCGPSFLVRFVLKLRGSPKSQIETVTPQRSRHFDGLSIPNDSKGLQFMARY